MACRGWRGSCAAEDTTTTFISVISSLFRNFQRSVGALQVRGSNDIRVTAPLLATKSLAKKLTSRPRLELLMFAWHSTSCSRLLISKQLKSDRKTSTVEETKDFGESCGTRNKHQCWCKHSNFTVRSFHALHERMLNNVFCAEALQQLQSNRLAISAVSDSCSSAGLLSISKNSDPMSNQLDPGTSEPDFFTQSWFHEFFSCSPAANEKQCQSLKVIPVFLPNVLANGSNNVCSLQGKPDNVHMELCFQNVGNNRTLSLLVLVCTKKNFNK